MKLLRKIFLLCALSLSFSANSQDLAIGHWREHLPYNKCIAIAEAGTRMYCATPFALFFFDRDDNTVQRLTKINGLSDIGINTMGYNTETKTLLLAYSNANIDLITPGGIINISDIKRKPILGDKSIYSILFVNNLAYLSCGFGIVVIDLVRQEVKDTYYIGDSGALLTVYAMTTDGGNFYAATESGIMQASVSNPNLSYYQNWTKLSSLPLPNASYNLIEYFSNKLIVNKHKAGSLPNTDSLLVFDGTQWTFFRPENTQTRYSMRKFGDRLLICYDQFVLELDHNMQQLRAIGDYGIAFAAPGDALLDNGNSIWIADRVSGMMRFKQYDDFSQYLLNGPQSENVFAMAGQNNILWAVPGAKDLSQGPVYIQAALYGFIDDKWTSFNMLNTPGFDTLHDFINIAIDPNNAEHLYINSFGKGVAEINKGALVKVYDPSNSTLQGHYLDPNSIRLGGITFDASGNLWMANSYTSMGLCLRTASGGWYSFNTGNNLEFGDIVANKINQKWITNPRSSTLMVYDDNGTLYNSADDKKKTIDVNFGNDVASGNILCIAGDLDGDIWVGTNKGIKVFYNTSDAFAGDYAAQTILLEQDGHWQHLLETESVTAIAIDGANRKWLGTASSGVYLMSADGTQQLAHFTESNSPLISDDITSICINQSTGEVFFGTVRGIISYKGTATFGGEKFESVYAYPNPVKHGYNGIIAIKGLVLNADVKITDVSGSLVYKTTAIGGQAIWNGLSLNGEKVKTGVYLVFCSNEDGTQTQVSKILFEN